MVRGVALASMMALGSIPLLPLSSDGTTPVVTKTAQTITFSSIPAVSYGVAPFNPVAKASSGLPVKFNLLSGPATIIGTAGTIKITGVGSVVIQASQPGNATYAAAANVTQAFIVSKAKQTITFLTLPDQVFGVAPILLGATSSSGFPVTYTLLPGSPATLSGSLMTITGVGTISVVANQAGSANYLPAAVRQNLVVRKPVLPKDVVMPSIFGTHMVLQQGITLPVWGTAAAGESVTVTVGGETGHAVAGLDGKWKVLLPPLRKGTAPVTMSVTGYKTVTYTDVLIGDVWLCSSQSNMWFPMFAVNDEATVLPTANDSGMRFFTVTANPTITPAADVTGTWSVCTPATARYFSGVGYFFGRQLRSEGKGPIGLIGSYLGGNPPECWMSLSSLAQMPQASYQAEVWRVQEAQAAAVATTPPPAPDKTTPTVLYNGMISPIIPYGIKGVLWYQGSDFNPDPDIFEQLYADLISDWRQRWGEGNIPFLYVQFQNAVQTNLDFPLVRQGELQSLEIPNTGMAVAIDIGDPATVHPTDKLDVGLRLALVADAVVYGQKVVYSGPVYNSMTVSGSSIVLNFNLEGSKGIKIGSAPWVPPGQKALPKTSLLGFTIAGVDQNFAPATALISGTSVIVSSPLVPKPVAVRYGWANNPSCNLYDLENLPASPFCTDTWSFSTSP